MATGRTLSKWARIYMGGYDISGDTRKVGSLPWVFDAPNIATITDGSDNHLLGTSKIGPFVMAGVLNNTATTGLHTLASANGTAWDLMVAIGMRAEPAQGDPVFCGKFLQKSYINEDDGGASVVAIEFQASDGGDIASYNRPWGTLLRPAATATTAVNSAVGVDDNGAATALGGYMMVQVLAGNGTATIKVQHAAVNADGSFADLGGCTTGLVDCSTPFAGIYNTTALTTTVNQYLRWQIAFTGANTVTFALAFVRGR